MRGRVRSARSCRRLYERYLEWNAANVRAWTKFAELEQALGETDRTRGIYELAIAQPVLDMPEALWKVRGHCSTLLSGAECEELVRDDDA
eukprot:359219-Chlamydomonas_euryale.AAC.4